MEKLKFFLLGVICTACLLFLLGAVPLGEVHRYQPVPIISDGAGLFIVDTQTGTTKIVWGKWRGGQLGKPFSDMAWEPSR